VLSAGGSAFSTGQRGGHGWYRPLLARPVVHSGLLALAATWTIHLKDSENQVAGLLHPGDEHCHAPFRSPIFFVSPRSPWLPGSTIMGDPGHAHMGQMSRVGRDNALESPHSTTVLPFNEWPATPRATRAGGA
jgi:hypothetical protein